MREPPRAPATLTASLPALLGARFRAHVAEKVALLLGLSVAICVPYFSVQHVDLFPVREAWVTALDRQIAFAPAWIWVYASLALLVPLAPLLAASREELVRHARGLAWLCVPSFLAFLVFPVAGPRPVVDAGGLYALVVGVDRPLNAFPSLHAGLTAYSLFYIARCLRAALPRRSARAGLAFGSVWALLILYSTLATKQHWLVDLPGGIALAGIAHTLAWRSAPR